MSKIIYLDHNATTAVHKEVVKAMEPFYNKRYGNASSVHQMGQDVRKAVEESRETIADYLGTEAVDIIFTSGGTESDNFAIKGVAFANKDYGNHIITSQIEHLAVIETCKFLEKKGFEVTYLPVDRYGLVSSIDLEKAITDRTVLVSIMHANNEVGTIQPISELAKVIKRANESRTASKKPPIYFHADAVQSLGKIPVDIEDLEVDLLSISAHKIYGPKGIGALYLRKGTKIAPYQYGGHHERNLRAGTENVPAIAGFARAVELAKSNFHKNEEIKVLRDILFEGLKEKIEHLHLNGHPEKRLPNTLNISFQFIEEESLLVNFDIKGICASTGSACTSGSLEQSHVLEAMGADPAVTQGAVRFSLGVDSTKEEIDYCINEIPPIVKRLRA